MKKWSWDLGCFCNFKCDYCFFTEAGWANIEKAQAGVRTVQEIARAWDNISIKYGSCEIYITGGEPFLYPGFAEIVSLLCLFHRIHVTSNLSQPLEEFLLFNKAGNIRFNSTYHPQHADIEGFAGQVLKLRKSGFSCDVCYLAHPMQLREMLNFKMYFMELGIIMTPTLYHGSYGGKIYPEGYSEQDRRLISITKKWDGGQDVRGMFYGENVESDAEEIVSAGSVPSYGSGCGAGVDNVAVGVDGTVRPCGRLTGPELGNIFRNDVALFERSFECGRKDCELWRTK